MEFSQSKSGQSILVIDKTYDEFGLPVSNRVGIIRPKDGSDVDGLVEMLKAGKGPKFTFDLSRLSSNGIYEMNRVTTPKDTTGSPAVVTEAAEHLTQA